MRRQHSIVETRNIVVGHMKRNDSVTRRFIQYCTMWSGEMLILVRDGKTGKIVTSPGEDQLWIFSEKHELGRASKKEWDVSLRSVTCTSLWWNVSNPGTVPQPLSEPPNTIFPLPTRHPVIAGIHLATSLLSPSQPKTPIADSKCSSVARMAPQV